MDPLGSIGNQPSLRKFRKEEAGCGRCVERSISCLLPPNSGLRLKGAQLLPPPARRGYASGSGRTEYLGNARPDGAA